MSCCLRASRILSEVWLQKSPMGDQHSKLPDEAFMATDFSENALNNVSGVVQYPSVFFE